VARLFFKYEKNREFYEKCEAVRSTQTDYLSTKEIASRGEGCCCSCFFMSEAHIKRLLWEMNTDRHVHSKFPHIREKHTEIYDRYKLLLSAHPDKLLSWYAEQISMQGAPRFYLDKDYATILYYKLMNKR
jgi:hypothetical protein